jgi:hypothetical protein
MGMYEQLGKPQFFLTLTCHAKQPRILAAVITAKLIRLRGRAAEEEVAGILYDYQRDENHKWEGMTRPSFAIPCQRLWPGNSCTACGSFFTGGAPKTSQRRVPRSRTVRMEAAATEATVRKRTSGRLPQQWARTGSFTA